MENGYFTYEKSYNFLLFKIPSVYMSTKEVCHSVSDCEMPLPRYQVIAKDSDACQAMENITDMYGNPSNRQILSGYLPEQKELKFGSATPACRSVVSFQP